MKRDALVILSQLEQEYLLHAIEAVLPVREAHQFYLWSQGQLQTLLPHQIMVSLQFDARDQLLGAACWHSAMLDAPLRERLCHASDGLVPRMARRCRAEAGPHLPAMLDSATSTSTSTSNSTSTSTTASPPPSPCASAAQPSARAAQPSARAAQPASPSALAAFDAELRELGLGNVIVHGTERLAGGASFFALFGAPHALRSRHAYFLELMLPYLHLAVQRMDVPSAATPPAGAGGAALSRPVSAREMQILHWVREGKSNDEIGLILGISGLTVKNHLQRLYRVLGVSNRTHAVTRCNALRLLDASPPPRGARTDAATG